MKLAFDEIRRDEYSPAPEAQQLGMLLINTVEDHGHLQGATVACMFRDDEITRHGRVTVAEAILVARILQSDRRWSRFVKWGIQQALGMTELPTFLILIDRNIWAGYSPEEKLALVDHELSHCSQQIDPETGMPKFNQQTGEPMWAIRAHDLEEFCGVVDRRGLWNADLVAMARSIVNALSRNAKEASA